VLHEAVWRRAAPRDQALLALEALESSPVKPRGHPRLGAEAWRLADELGWAKTYDAEYLALALLLEARLVTEDARLWRRLAHLEVVVRPVDL
jgi:predicted nucleic acid-binding protein